MAGGFPGGTQFGGDLFVQARHTADSDNWEPVAVSWTKKASLAAVALRRLCAIASFSGGHCSCAFNGGVIHRQSGYRYLPLFTGRERLSLLDCWPLLEADGCSHWVYPLWKNQGIIES